MKILSSSELCALRLCGAGKSPAREPGVPAEKCDLCGLEFCRDRLRRMGNLLLCPACVEVYCDACYPLFSADFIEENGRSFYTGWFEGLSAEEQLDCLRAGYRQKYRALPRSGRARMRAHRREFCSSRVNEDWPAYVSRRLNDAYHKMLN